jgi:hypothetical protein
MESSEDEASLRHPQGGTYDGHCCTCTRECPATCDGTNGCEARTRAWFDAGPDELIGPS